MSQKSMIVFVCEHGAAKSVIAAAYFNRLAVETGLEFRAIARATNPDDELSPQAIAGLREDGLAPSESVPQKLSLEDAEAAQRMITFCELPEEYHHKAIIEQWENVPPVSGNYKEARHVILGRIKKLVNDI